MAVSLIPALDWEKKKLDLGFPFLWERMNLQALWTIKPGGQRWAMMPLLLELCQQQCECQGCVLPGALWAKAGQQQAESPRAQHLWLAGGPQEMGPEKRRAHSKFPPTFSNKKTLSFYRRKCCFQDPHDEIKNQIP